MKSALPRAFPRRIPALLTAIFIAASLGRLVAGDVIITEIHYHPLTSPESQREFIEIKHVGPLTDAPINLGGWKFTEGVTYTFPANTMIAPGAFRVLVSNEAQFQASYPGVAVTGVYLNQLTPAVVDDKLANAGMRLTLVDAAMNEVFSVNYDDKDDVDAFGLNPWSSLPDGNGYTLVSFNPDGNPDPDDGRNWRASIRLHGSPGANEPVAGVLPIYVNEVRTRDGVLANDAIELYNPNGSTVNIGGWFLTDNVNDQRTKYSIPANTMIGAGQYLVFNEATLGFGISSTGERAFLFSGAAGALTGYVDGFHFRAAEDGVTFGRYVNTDGVVQYPAQSSITLEAANAGPKVGPVVITELLYEPAIGGVEFIEIQNISGATVQLFDPANTADTWNISGVNFVLPAGQSLAPGEIALIVANAPATFLAANPSIPAGTKIFGPFAVGVTPPSLRNGGELVALHRSERLDPAVPLERHYIVVDAVTYNDDPPWPVDAGAGIGRSIERINPSAYGDESTNWKDSLEIGGSPGRILNYTGPPIHVNEILAHTDLPQTDAIELYNPNASAVNIGGWFLSDGRNSPKKFKIPAGTMIPAGGYWVVNEDNDDNTNTQPPVGYFGTPGGFALSENGESVVLSSADAAGNLTGYQERVVFEGTDNGVSVGRVVDSQGRVDHVPLSSITFTINRFIPNPAGAPNSAPKIGPVVISELFYNPAGADPEFLEITNITGATVALYDNSPGGNPANNWLFSAGVTFTFPGSFPTLAAGARMIILPQGTDAATFRTANNVPAPVVIHGGAAGYVGALNNGGEKIVLAKKGPPNADEGFVAPVVPIDYVDYSDVAPWPLVGSLGGRSIERITLSTYGSNFDNWKASNALKGSPGTANSTGVVYGTWALANFTEAELAMTARTAPGGDFNGDGVINLQAYAFGFSPKTIVNPALLPQAYLGDDSGSAYLGLSFRMRIPPNDLTYLAQYSGDLIDWSGTATQVGVPIANPDGTFTVKYRDPGLIGDEPQRLLRVKVTMP